MTFEAVKCPHCKVAGRSEINPGCGSNVKWNCNYNCYSKIVFCTCHNCGTDFFMEELYDVVDYDENSIKINFVP